MAYKQLTPESWLEVDPAFLTNARITLDDFLGFLKNPHPLLSKLADPRPVGVRPTDWLKSMNSFRLAEQVPEDIRDLYEAARGMFAYGYCYFPLCSLAVQQLWRVFESAVSRKYSELRAPASRKTFEKKLDWLFEQGALDPALRQQLTAVRDLRNMSSHPEHQSIVPTVACGQEFLQIASLINTLFRPEAKTP